MHPRCPNRSDHAGNDRKWGKGTPYPPKNGALVHIGIDRGFVAPSTWSVAENMRLASDYWKKYVVTFQKD